VVTVIISALWRGAPIAETDSPRGTGQVLFRIRAISNLRVADKCWVDGQAPQRRRAREQRSTKAIPPNKPPTPSIRWWPERVRNRFSLLPGKGVSDNFEFIALPAVFLFDGSFFAQLRRVQFRPKRAIFSAKVVRRAWRKSLGVLLRLFLPPNKKTHLSRPKVGFQFSSAPEGNAESRRGASVVRQYSTIRPGSEVFGNQIFVNPLRYQSATIGSLEA
jgi:hypothetical protein